MFSIMRILEWFLFCLRHPLIKAFNLQLQLLHNHFILLPFSNQAAYSILLVLWFLPLNSFHRFNWLVLVLVWGHWAWPFDSETGLDWSLCAWALNVDVDLFFWCLSSGLRCIHACYNLRYHFYERDVLRINYRCTYAAGSNRHLGWSTSFACTRVLDV